MEKENTFFNNEYSISQRLAIANDWIGNSTYRAIYEDKIYNGLANEQLAIKYNYSVNQISNILKKCDEIVSAHINDPLTILENLFWGIKSGCYVVNIIKNNNL